MVVGVVMVVMVSGGHDGDIVMKTLRSSIRLIVMAQMMTTR